MLKRLKSKAVAREKDNSSDRDGRKDRRDTGPNTSNGSATTAANGIASAKQSYSSKNNAGTNGVPLATRSYSNTSFTSTQSRRTTSKIGQPSLPHTQQTEASTSANDSSCNNRKGLQLIPQTFTPEEARSLEYTVTSRENVNLPYGNGAEKLFGIENYGYICYVSSIFQCLYHTPQFRNSILEFTPKGATSGHRRRRKYAVLGKRKDVIPHAISSINHHMAESTTDNTNAGKPSTPISTSTLASVPVPNSAQSSNPSLNRRISIFSRSNTESSNNTSDALGSTADHDNNDYDAKTYTQSDFSLNEKLQNHVLARRLTSKYPALKDIDVNYFLNSQKNVSLVGIIKDPQASLDWRKKAALIRGPIINLDESFISEYGFDSENMFTVLKDAFESIVENASKTGVLSPYNLIEVIKKENIMFRNAQHQDAHEFLNFMMNNISENMKQYEGGEKIITDIFEGELTSETKCLTCDTASYRNEKFLDLSIDLEPDSSITNCLKMFSKIELLNEDNKFYCENCYSYQEAAKSMKLKKIPKVLAFHLKRFKYSEQLGRLVKLFYRVEYVKTLRICNTTKDSKQPDKLYELYGVIVHIGGGPYHGHYVSLVKTELFGWLLFDDETIEKIDEDYVFKFFGDGSGLSTAYLLFYREVEDEMKFIKAQLEGALADGNDADEDVDDYRFEGAEGNAYEHESSNSRPIYQKRAATRSSSLGRQLAPPGSRTSQQLHQTMSASTTASTTSVSTPALAKRQSVSYTIQANHAIEEFDPFGAPPPTLNIPSEAPVSTGTSTSSSPHSVGFENPTSSPVSVVPHSRTEPAVEVPSRRNSIFGFRRKK